MLGLQLLLFDKPKGSLTSLEGITQKQLVFIKNVGQEFMYNYLS